MSENGAFRARLEHGRLTRRSTLPAIFGVLQRFYEISSGSITFGGIDYRFIPIERLRSCMAVVSQSAVLFEGDIRFNLSVRRGYIRIDVPR